MSLNKESETVEKQVATPVTEADILALPTEELHPMLRPFEQTITIEWTPYELVQERTQRKLIVDKLKREAEGILAQVAPHERHIAHLERLLELPSLKALVLAEDAYLKSTAVDKAVEEVTVEEAPAEKEKE